MMGFGQICRLKLLIVALHYLINATPGHGSCQRKQSADSHPAVTFLIAYNGSGVEITVYPDKLHSDTIDNRTYFIPDRRLPPECGAQYFRCQDLLVETFLPQDGGEINVLFIPLERGMAIITSPLNDLTWERHRFVVDSPDCSPTVIYKAGESLFTVCMNFTLQHIAVYEIQLYWNEKQIIDRAVFEGPRTQLSIINLTTSILSNFVLEVSSLVHKVYFAAHNAIFVMDVLDPTQTTKTPDLPQCQLIHKLTSAEALLLAYCSDRYMYLYFDPVYGDMTMPSTATYFKCGIPYLCPNNNYKVAFFNNTDGDFLQFTKEGSMLNPIYNIDINSGICFEIENTTYFTWSDPQHNSVFIFDFVSGNCFPLISSYKCSSMDCPQLLLLKNQYIVVHSDVNVFVIDAKNKFSLIVNVSLAISDVLTAVFVDTYKADTPRQPSTVTLSPSTNISTTMVSPFETTYTTTTTSTPIKNVVASTSVIVSPFSVTYTTRSISYSTYSLSSRTMASTFIKYVASTTVIVHTTTTVSPFTNVLSSSSTVSLYGNDSTTTSAPVVHNNVLIAIIPTIIIVIAVLVVISVMLLIYKIAKRRWCNIYQAPTRPRSRFFTNNHPVPPRMQLTMSDAEDDEQNSEEVEMQPLVEKNWLWKII